MTRSQQGAPKAASTAPSTTKPAEPSDAARAKAAREAVDLAVDDSGQAETSAPQADDSPAQVSGRPPTTDATTEPTDAKGENKGEDGETTPPSESPEAPADISTAAPALPPDSDDTADPNRQATNPSLDPALLVAVGAVPPSVDSPASRVPPETPVAMPPDFHGRLPTAVTEADLSEEDRTRIRAEVEASVRAQIAHENDSHDRQRIEAEAALEVLAERPFGTEPGEEPLRIETISRARANDEIRGGVDVIYQGLRQDILYPHGISVIVPDGTEAELEDVGYDGPFTTGTSYNFRAGVVSQVRGKHVAWLEGHPTYRIERA